MPYNNDHYKMDENGYSSKDEAERAVENGHLDKCSDGSYYDRETGESFWSDGTKK